MACGRRKVAKSCLRERWMGYSESTLFVVPERDLTCVAAWICRQKERSTTCPWKVNHKSEPWCKPSGGTKKLVDTRKRRRETPRRVRPRKWRYAEATDKLERQVGCGVDWYRYRRGYRRKAESVCPEIGPTSDRTRRNRQKILLNGWRWAGCSGAVIRQSWTELLMFASEEHVGANVLAMGLVAPPWGDGGYLIGAHVRQLEGGLLLVPRLLLQHDRGLEQGRRPAPELDFQQVDVRRHALGVERDMELPTAFMHIQRCNHSSHFPQCPWHMQTTTCCQACIQNPS